MEIKRNGTVEVLVDTRERTPIVFPSTITYWHATHGFIPVRVKTTKTKLEAGDYTVRGGETAIGVERKGAFSEIYRNTSTVRDRPRFLRAFDKFVKAYQWKILLLDFPNTPERHNQLRTDQEWMAMAHLWKMAAEKNISVFWWPCRTTATRLRTGEAILHFMLNAASKQ